MSQFGCQFKILILSLQMMWYMSFGKKKKMIAIGYHFRSHFENFVCD